MAIELVAELATSHGGDVDLACDMVKAAADAGAHTVKIQSYTLAHLNKKDPQYPWLSQSVLDEEAHTRIMEACVRAGVRFLSTPFDRESLDLLMDFDVDRVKVPSSLPLWNEDDLIDGVWQIKSWAWGKREDPEHQGFEMHLSTIPIYPASLEMVAGVPLLDGWSDHVPGIAACQYMLSKGASIIEAHFCLPGRSRVMPWDKNPQEFRAIRDYADHVETMTTGISQVFRERWTA